MENTAKIDSTLTMSSFARAMIVITTISAAVMELLDTTIVNVALNQMSGSLGATIEDTAWVVTSYAIANVIIIPMTSFLGEYFGRKTYYLGSMILFGIASYLCGTSSGLWELVFWRFIQGIGGGALLSTSQSILFDAFPGKSRGVASGLFGMGIVMGPTLGPTLGGYIVDNFTWSDIFFVNVPICVIASMLTITFIERKPEEGKNKKNITIDYLGILLLVVGVGCLQYILERGESKDWFHSREIVLFTIATVIGLGGFVLWELYYEHPVVNLKIFRYRTFAFCTLFMLIAGIGMFTSVFVYPVMVQRINGFTSYETGLSLLYPTLIVLVIFPVMGKRMAAGDSPIPYVTIGIIGSALFGFYSGTATPDMGRWDFYPMQLLRTFSIGLLNMPLINLSVSGLQPKEYPAGISLTNMIRQLGGAIGIAIANNYTVTRYAQHRADLIKNYTETNPIFVERFNMLKMSVMNRTGDAITAANTAYKQLDLMLDRQAYYLSYLDTFRVVSIFFICILPMVFLLRTKKKSATEVALAAKAMEESH